MFQCQLVVATAAEARPLIDHFKLKQLQHGAYRCYHNEQFSLVETGIGKLAAAGATAWALTQSDNQSTSRAPICLNIGIAGGTQPIGDLVAAHRVVDTSTRTQWFPQLVCKPPGKLVSVETVDVPSTDYQNNVAFDMEASGILATATRFMTLEFIHSLKVISDNAASSIDAVKPDFASQLIEAHLIDIAQFAENLIELSLQLPDTSSVDSLLARITSSMRITVSQSVKLRQLLFRYKAHYNHLPTEEELRGWKTCNEMTAHLESTLNAKALSY